MTSYPQVSLQGPAGRPRSTGFTLLELMIAVAILSLIAAISMPIYQGYIETSREGALIQSMSSMGVFQEDWRMRNGTYLAGEYDAGAPDAALAPLGWEPNDPDVEYVVAVNAGVNYTITATDEAGVVVCRQFPGANPCP